MLQSLVSNLKEILPELNTKRVLLFAFLVATIIGGYVVFENRQDLYNTTISRFDRVGSREQPPLKVTKNSRELISYFAGARESIVLVTVLDMNIRKNTRSPVYRFFADREVERIMLAADRAGISGALPIFTSSEVQNRQMISLINGQFNCSATNGSGITAAYPALDGRIKYSCRVPIPPYYGQLIGYIAVHLNKVPSEYELDQLRVGLFQLSVTIFNEDINTNPIMIIK